MPSGKKGDALVKSFLKELSESLDLKKTIKRLNITEEEARGFFSYILSKLYGQEPSVRKPLKKDRFFSVYVDGASRGNPGEAGAGAVIKDIEGNVIKRLKRSLGVTTNNVAEYKALILGLKEAQRLGCSRIRVFVDSELVVKHVKGEYRVKNEGLRPLYSKAMHLLEGFKGFEISHITRNKNVEADRLANKAIDRRDEPLDVL
jgi:ribonuclease HI